MRTNPIDLIIHYLTVFPLNRKKRKANNSNTVSTHNGSVGIVILRLLYVYWGYSKWVILLVTERTRVLLLYNRDTDLREQRWNKYTTVLNFSSKHQNELFYLKKDVPTTLYQKDLEKNEQPTSSEHSIAQIMVSKYHFPLKGAKAPKRNSWFHICGKKCIRQARNSLKFQKSKTAIKQ